LTNLLFILLYVLLDIYSPVIIILSSIPFY